MQHEAIASCPIASYLGEETTTCLTTTSCQRVVESKKDTYGYFALDNADIW